MRFDGILEMMDKSGIPTPKKAIRFNITNSKFCIDKELIRYGVGNYSDVSKRAITSWFNDNKGRGFLLYGDVDERELAPKVEYFDQVLQSDALIPTNVIAKELGMSAITLNAKLNKLGILYKSGETWVLYHKDQNKGYTGTKTASYTDSKGSAQTHVHTYWTEKGRKFIHDVMAKAIRLEPCRNYEQN